MDNLPLDNLYHTIKAETADEAKAKSPYFIGQEARVAEISATANSDGTWHVTARYSLTGFKPKR